MKIAFLFLIISEIYHEKCWMDFFKGHDELFSIYIHSKNPMSETSPFKGYEIKQKIATSWSNTMDAQVELLREALKDKENYKFIFISESTIPLQPFVTAYRDLVSTPLSQFSIEKENSRNRKFWPIPSSKIYKNSQWVVLNRKHAELVVSDDTYLKIMTKYHHDQEHYPSTFLKLINLAEEVMPQDSTLTLWSAGRAHPHTFYYLQTDPYFKVLIEEIGAKRMLFARKFSKECDLTPLKAYIDFMK